MAGLSDDIATAPFIPSNQAPGPLREHRCLHSRGHPSRRRRSVAGSGACRLCATPPTDPIERAAFEQNNDPLEPMNREILDFNLFLDRILLKPVPSSMSRSVPEQGRDTLKRALDNMKEPVVAINNVLQGELGACRHHRRAVCRQLDARLRRLLRRREAMGPEKADRRFRADAVRLGVAAGTLSDAPGSGPVEPARRARHGGRCLHGPVQLIWRPPRTSTRCRSPALSSAASTSAPASSTCSTSLQKNSLDFYAQLRSLSQQRRAAELRHGAAPPPGGDLYQDPGKPAAPPAKPAVPSATRTTAPTVAAAKSRPRVHVASKTQGASYGGISITLRSARP